MRETLSNNVGFCRQPRRIILQDIDSIIIKRENNIKIEKNNASHEFLKKIASTITLEDIRYHDEKKTKD